MYNGLSNDNIHPLSPNSPLTHSRRPSRHSHLSQENENYFSQGELTPALPKSSTSTDNIHTISSRSTQINVRPTPNQAVSTHWHELTDSEIAHTVPLLANSGDFSPYHSTIKSLSSALSQLSRAAEQWEHNLNSLRAKIREAYAYAITLEGDERKGAEAVLGVIDELDAPVEVRAHYSYNARKTHKSTELVSFPRASD